MNSNKIICEGIEYESKFKEGDRVTVNGYYGVLVLDSIDEMLTSISKKIHWNTVSESYLLGKSKTNNGESYSEDEINLVTPAKK